MIDVGEARMGSYGRRPSDNVTWSFESLCVSPPIAPVGRCAFHPRCPYAFDRCRQETPPLYQVALGHVAAYFSVPEATGPEKAS